MFSDVITWYRDVLFLSIFDAYGAFSAAVGPVWYGLLTITVLIVYLLAFISKWRLPLRELLFYALRIVFATLLLFSWPVYADFFLLLYIDVPNAITSDMVVHLSGGASGDVHAQLDLIWDKGMSSTSRVLNIAGVTNPASYLIAGIIFLSTVVFIVLGGGLLLVAMGAVFFLLIVGPLFVALWVFGWTSRTFQLWNAQMFNYALLGIFVLLLLAATGVLVEKAVLQTDLALTRDKLTFYEAGLLLIAVLFFGVLLRQVPKMTTGVASGLALDAGHFAAWGWQKGKQVGGKWLSGIAHTRRAARLERQRVRIWKEART